MHLKQNPFHLTQWLLLGILSKNYPRQISILVKGGFQLLDLIIPELKSHVIPYNSSALIGGKFICKKNPLQDLLSCLNVVISTNERA